MIQTLPENKKKTVEQESGGDTGCNKYTQNGLKMFRKKTGGT